MDKWISILKILGPAIMMVVPGGQPFIPLVIAGIQVAEMSGQPGAEKKKIAKDAIKLGAETANAIAKKEVMKPSDAVAVADNAIDAIVGAVNIVHNVKSEVTKP